MLVAGVDEVGRGPLIGNVVTAAVILNPEKPIIGLTDSKKISEKKRVALAEEIKSKALCWSIAQANPDEIDKLNILHATMLAMCRAVDGLSVPPDFVKVDGNRVPDWQYKAESVVKGDATVPEISAASILAKVARDRQMLQLHEQYPNYAFDKHKGYPTALHLEKLMQHGVLPEHRTSFKPVSKLLHGG
ncbi:MAG: ribonuclease HII [Aestuariibacter sp.]